MQQLSIVTKAGCATQCQTSEVHEKRIAKETLHGQRKFAERLRNLRRNADLSQQRLADLSGVGRVTIARIEAVAQSPKLDTIQKLAAAMGLPVQALMTDDWAEFTSSVSE